MQLVVNTYLKLLFQHYVFDQKAFDLAAKLITQEELDDREKVWAIKNFEDLCWSTAEVSLQLGITILTVKHSEGEDGKKGQSAERPLGRSDCETDEKHSYRQRLSRTSTDTRTDFLQPTNEKWKEDQILGRCEPSAFFKSFYRFIGKTVWW